MTSIKLFAVWFSNEIPRLMPEAMRSWGRNPKIDFHLFTNLDFPNQLAPNITITRTSVKEFYTVLSQRLGFPILVQSPRKICDFRPLFGTAFADQITNHDYWGSIDLDLILGRFYEIACLANLERYDCFMRWGHLRLFKNVQHINQLYLKAGTDYLKTRILNGPHIGFDECSGINKIIADSGVPFMTEEIGFDALPNLPYLSSRVFKGHWTIKSNKDASLIAIKKGTNSEHEVSYLHLQKRKLCLFSGELPWTYTATSYGAANQLPTNSESRPKLSEELNWLRYKFQNRKLNVFPHPVLGL